MHAPQIVSRQFRFAGCFKCFHIHAQRVYVLKHMAYGAVFARGVHALQNHQQLAFALSIQSVLQPIQFGRQFRRQFITVFFGFGNVFAVLARVVFPLPFFIAINQKTFNVKSHFFFSFRCRL